MSDIGGLDWTEEQWSRVRQLVHDEALRGRVGAAFLPLYGPLADNVETVPRNLYEGVVGPGGQGLLTVDDTDVLRLCTVAVNVQLRGAQAADPELASASILFRRAAAIVARIEDAIVFNGQPKADAPPARGIEGLEAVFTVRGGGAHRGLLDTKASGAPVAVPGGDAPKGPDVFAAVVEAVSRLESSGHYGPFACVLGDRMFQAVNTPIAQSMVLPRDSILPYLGGPLLRASAAAASSGLVVSLQGDPAEIVVAKDISVRYLQATLEARHVFRVSQRFVLRIKEPRALVRLETAAAAA